MLRSQIQKRVNDLLAGETLSYFEMRPFLDQAVDDINQNLGAKFPAFSELPDEITEYKYIPERYMRSVVCLGAAMYFYKTDEEGGAPPPGYFSDYDNNMFLMLRDYLPLVPKEFVDNTTQGVLDFVLDGEVSSDENIFNVAREDMTI